MMSYYKSSTVGWISFIAAAFVHLLAGYLLLLQENSPAETRQDAKILQVSLHTAQIAPPEPPTPAPVTPPAPEPPVKTPEPEVVKQPEPMPQPKPPVIAAPTPEPEAATQPIEKEPAPVPVTPPEPPATVREETPPPKTSETPVITDTVKDSKREPAPASTAPAEKPVVAPRFQVAYLKNPAPRYPRLSRRLKEEGTVILRVHVNADGRPGTIEISESSGFERLDNAAKDTVKQWRFVPARQGDHNISAWVKVPVTYSLRS